MCVCVCMHAYAHMYMHGKNEMDHVAAMTKTLKYVLKHENHRTLSSCLFFFTADVTGKQVTTHMYAGH